MEPAHAWEQYQGRRHESGGDSAAYPLARRTLQRPRFSPCSRGLCSKNGLSEIEKNGVDLATGQDPVVPVRLPKTHLSALDNWRTKQEPKLTRSEAIRRLLEIAFLQ